MTDFSCGDAARSVLEGSGDQLTAAWAKDDAAGEDTQTAETASKSIKSSAKGQPVSLLIIESVGYDGLEMRKGTFSLPVMTEPRQESQTCSDQWYQAL